MTKHGKLLFHKNKIIYNCAFYTNLCITPHYVQRFKKITIYFLNLCTFLLVYFRVRRYKKGSFFLINISTPLIVNISIT